MTDIAIELGHRNSEFSYKKCDFPCSLSLPDGTHCTEWHEDPELSWVCIPQAVDFVCFLFLTYEQGMVFNSHPYGLRIEGSIWYDFGRTKYILKK